MASPETLNPTQTEKRKREDDIAEDTKDESKLHPLHKTSLCSYFRRDSGSCSHGSECRYAHGEEELRQRPDKTWDPTSERAKKLRRVEGENENEGEKEVMMTDVVVEDGEDESEGFDRILSKCLVNLPRKWSSDQLRKFLNDQGILFKSAKKKKGMPVGFVNFENAEQMNNATEELEEKSIGNKKIKVGDVIPRPFEKKINSAAAGSALEGENAEVFRPSDATSNDDDNDGGPVVDGSVSGGKTARDVVTPLAHMAYADQLEHKKNSIAQMLKKLTRNARKACPNGVSLPEWVLKSREIGGLSCNLEGILESPLINGYRNKCEFSVGYSLQGKPTVGFLLGTFREGVTAVEEPVDCPNVSDIASTYALIFQDFLQSSSLPIWNRFKNTGFWRQLTVREGRFQGKAINLENPEANISEVMLIVQASLAGFDDAVVAGELERLAHSFASRAASNSPPLPLTVLVLQNHEGISNVAPADAPLRTLPLSNKENDAEGDANTNLVEARIHDYINNLRFSISPTAFFQVNTLAAEKLYSLAGDWAGLGPDTLLFDVCCGTGTIGLTLAHRVGMVVGIEMNASAVSDAHRNAEINGIKNCRFVCGKAEDVMGSLLKEYFSLTQKEEQPDAPESNDIDDSVAEGKGGSIDKEVTDKDTTHELENGENSSGSPDSSIQEPDNQVQKSCVSDKDDAVAEGKDDSIDKEVTDKDTRHELGNDEYVSVSPDSSIQEPENQVQKSCASEDTGPPLPQFKNVVAIVDPPRGGLHPIVIKALRTHSHLRRLVYISCNPETLVANAIELCTPSPDKVDKGSKNNWAWRRMSSAGLARHRAKSMPVSEPFHPVKAMAVDLFPHTPHCEMVMLLER